MPSKRLQFINGEIYHISDRAVGDSVIFKDESDYFRGIFSCYEFNNAKPVNIWQRRQQRRKEKIKGKEILLGPTPQNFAGPDPAKFLALLANELVIPRRDVFVELMVFVFMPNHFHLILRQLKENGISLFMQKIGGYSTYFNEKYGRRGHLFNRFYAKHIETDEQLITTFLYDHINPVSLVEPGWKEKGIKDQEKVMKFLENEYRWSSLFDYLGKENFPSVTSRDFLLELMGGEDGCRQQIKNWISYKKADSFGDIF